MSRMLLFTAGIACLLNFTTPTLADDLDEQFLKAARLRARSDGEERLLRRLRFTDRVERDDKQEGKPIIGLTHRGAGNTANNFLKEIQGIGNLDIRQVVIYSISDLPTKVDQLESLAGLEQLTHLYLLNSEVSDAGWKSLGELKGLTTLGLYGTKVTPRGLKEITRLNKLETLYLGGEIPKTLQKHIFPEAFQGERILEEKELKEFFRACFPKQTDPADLNLTELWAMKNLNTIGIPGKPDGSHKTLTITKKATDESLAGLREAELLHLLPRATDKKGKPATKTEDVTSLYLSSSKVTDAGLKELAPFKNLTTLSLLDTKVTDAGLKELANLKELTTLYLAQTKVTDAGVKELQQALPKCKIER